MEALNIQKKNFMKNSRSKYIVITLILLIIILLATFYSIFLIKKDVEVTMGVFRYLDYIDQDNSAVSYTRLEENMEIKKIGDYTFLEADSKTTQGGGNNSGVTVNINLSVSGKFSESLIVGESYIFPLKSLENTVWIELQILNKKSINFRYANEKDKLKDKEYHLLTLE